MLPEDGSRVKFPRPGLPIWIPNTSAPPFGPGMTWESLPLLTKTRGGLLDAAAHNAREMVTSEEEGGKENKTGEEVVEKLFPVRVSGVSKERVVCARVEGMPANTRAQMN